MATSCSLQATPSPAAPAASAPAHVRPPSACLCRPTVITLQFLKWGSLRRRRRGRAATVRADSKSRHGRVHKLLYGHVCWARALWPLLKCSRRWPYTCTRPATTSHPTPHNPFLAQVYDPHNASAINADVAPHSMLPIIKT